MTRHLIRKILIVLVAMTFAQVAYAATFRAEPVRFFVTHRIENNESLRSVNNTFLLEAKDDAPMPEGSEDGVKKVVAPANSTFDFGEINYPKQGTYEYTVRRVITNSKSLVQDDAEYDIRIAVFSDGTNVTVFEKAGTNAKTDELEYTDTYLTKLTFILNGGTYKGKTENIIQYHPAGTTVTLLEAPTKKNATFEYWRGSKYAAGAKYKVTTEDHTFTAMYKGKAGSRRLRSGAQTGDAVDIIILLGAASFCILAFAVYKRRRK